MLDFGRLVCWHPNTIITSSYSSSSSSSSSYSSNPKICPHDYEKTLQAIQMKLSEGVEDDSKGYNPL